MPNSEFSSSIHVADFIRLESKIDGLWKEKQNKIPISVIAMLTLGMLTSSFSAVYSVGVLMFKVDEVYDSRHTAKDELHNEEATHKRFLKLEKEVDDLVMDCKDLSTRLRLVELNLSFLRKPYSIEKEVPLR